jgi:serine/threonine protein kinase
VIVLTNEEKTYELEEKFFAKGGFGKLYRVTRGTGIVSERPMVAKVFTKPEVTPKERETIRLQLIYKLGSQGMLSLDALNALNNMVNSEVSKREKERMEKWKSFVEAEMKGLSKLYHVQDCFETVTGMVVITELLDNTEELQHLPKNTSFVTRTDIAKQVAFSLYNMHNIISEKDKVTIHRDIKPANVLIPNAMARSATTPGEIRPGVHLIDFNLSTEVKRQNGSSHYDQFKSIAALGTAEYLAPEILYGRPISTKTDIFSLGIVIFELFFLAPREEHSIHTRYSRQTAITPFADSYAKDFYGPRLQPGVMDDADIAIKHFVLRMLADDSLLRPNTEEVLQFFTILDNLAVFAESASDADKVSMQDWLALQKAQLRLLAQGQWYTALTEKGEVFANLNFAKHPHVRDALAATPLSPIAAGSSFNENAANWLRDGLATAGVQVIVDAGVTSHGHAAMPARISATPLHSQWTFFTTHKAVKTNQIESLVKEVELPQPPLGQETMQPTESQVSTLAFK